MGGRKDTALALAAKSGNLAAAHLIASHGDINTHNLDDCETLLLYSAAQGYKDAVQLTLSRRDVRVEGKYLIDSATIGHAEVMRLLLSRGETDAYDRGRSLAAAATHGHEDAVQLLLSHENVPANYQRNDMGRAPLHHAAARGHEAVVRVLLENMEVEANIIDDHRCTPLHYASQQGHETVVRQLLRRKDIDVNAMSIHRKTPLHHASEHGNEAVVRVFLEHRDVNVNVKCMYNYTLLHHTSRQGNEAIMRLLLGHRYTDVNVKGMYEYTPLHCASERGNEAVVRLLLGHRYINVNVTDNHKRTPLHYASSNGYKAIVRLLLGHHIVKPSVKNDEGLTPLDLALYYRKISIAQLLNEHCARATGFINKHYLWRKLRCYDLVRDPHHHSEVRKRNMLRRQRAVPSRCSLSSERSRFIFPSADGYSSSGRHNQHGSERRQADNEQIDLPMERRDPQTFGIGRGPQVRRHLRSLYPGLEGGTSLTTTRIELYQDSSMAYTKLGMDYFKISAAYWKSPETYTIYKSPRISRSLRSFQTQSG